VKERLEALLKQALIKAADKNLISVDLPFPPLRVTAPKEKEHGDFTSNAALVLAKSAKMDRGKLAELLVSCIEDADGIIEKVEIAMPGYINFFVKPAGLFEIIGVIERQGKDFGCRVIGSPEKVMVEFVSANPTGPLHVGHGRGAAFGDALANLLEFAGHSVFREYYINDSGLQIQTLGNSVWLRYKELLGETIRFPDDHYKGAYIVDLAKKLLHEKGTGLTETDLPQIVLYAADQILNEIKADLARFNVHFDNWFSERTLYEKDSVTATLNGLRRKGLAYESDGALWFAASKFGDEKDRVLIKSSGEKTYLAGDIAYHSNKLRRGFERLIDIWGSDHHGYVSRMKAGIQALGKDPEALQVLLIQMVHLTRGGEKISMSTRAGTFVTLEEVYQEVGVDAARYMFLTRRHDAQLEFDLELAKELSSKNPVYYVQYMHARICSIFKKALEANIPIPSVKDIEISALQLEEEAQIARRLAEFPELIRQAAVDYEPHRLTTYLYELANKFHTYYYNHRVLADDPAITAARLALCSAVRIVTQNALKILGVSAPESM